MDQRRVAGKTPRCRHILDPVPFPQSRAGAEGGQAAFSGNARAGQDRDPHASAAKGLGPAGETLVARPERVVGIAFRHPHGLRLIRIAEERGRAALV